MRTNQIFLIVIIYLFPHLIYGQRNYIETDSVLTIGIEIIDGLDWQNSEICQVKRGKNITKFSPFELKEYGFSDGRIYVSKDIHKTDSSAKRVFLERLVKGNTTLYYYRGKAKKTFYIERDSSFLIELPRNEKENKNFTFHDQLLNFTSDCPNISEATKLVTYNKNSFTKLIQQYNNCDLKPFPHFRFGLIVGYEIAKLIPVSDNSNENINYFDFSYDGGFLSGLFIDSPISASDFSLHTEFYYSKHGYSFNKHFNNKDFDFIANVTSLEVPLLVRYSYPSNNFRPFIDLGGLATFNIKHENLLLETTVLNSIIEINATQNTSLISKNQAGYSVGAGIEHSLNAKKSLFVELRYNKLFDNVRVLNESVINLMTGINF